MTHEFPLNTIEALKTRKSIRAFTDQSVSMETVQTILEVAARAPSGSNIQPWQVVVLTGDALKTLGQELYDLSMENVTPEREFYYYPRHWREPYLARRRKVGWDLYNSVGIERGEKEKMAVQQARNYLFFDAPVGLLFTMDRDMEIGSWLDLGMFMQSIMVAARSLGMDTCPEAAFANYYEHIGKRLDFLENTQLICGMALGYADKTARENNFTTEREPVESFTRFVNHLD